MFLRRRPNVPWDSLVPRRGLFFPWGHATEESARKTEVRRDRQVLRSAPTVPGSSLLSESATLKEQILLQQGGLSQPVVHRSEEEKSLMLSKEEEYSSYKRKFLLSRIDDELNIFHDPSSGPFMERTHAQWVRLLWKYPIPSVYNYDYYAQEERKKEHTKLVRIQLLDEKRLVALGPDLSAAWFLLSRNCRVRFKDQETWVENQGDLPTTFKAGHCLEAIEASRSLLVYEGLQNLRNLSFLKHLDISYCEFVDEWFIDRITGEFRETLEYLDVSGCYRLDWNGIEPLARLVNLKVLILRDLDHIEDLKLICLLLLEVNPDLDIRGVDYIDIELLKAGGNEDLLEDLERDLLLFPKGNTPS